MARAGALPEDTDLAWWDEPLERAMWAMTRRDPRPALDLLARTRADPHRRELCVDVLGQVGHTMLIELEALADQDRDDADRWLLFGAALSAAGWVARGHDTRDRTSDVRIDAMQRLASRGRAVLRRAAELAPEDPVPWSELQGCAMPATCRAELDELYDTACRLAPDLYQANVIRLMTLTRKWYGSQQEVVDFAVARTEGLPAGHPLHALVPWAYLEDLVDQLMLATNVALRAWRYLRFTSNPAARSMVDAAADRLLADDVTYAGHPAFMRAHQAFAAFYFKIAERSRAWPHLRRGGHRPAAMPWGYFGSGPEEFREARDRAGLPVP